MGRAPAVPRTFRAAPPRGRPADDPHEGHVKVMLAYSHSLSYDHQGFRPFAPDHREAAGPVGPAVARVQVHCKLQTMPPCALATASTAVMEVSNFSKVLLLGNVEVGQAAYMG